MGRIVDENYEPVYCDALDDEPKHFDSESWKTTITDLPPVEYAPVKHGRWVKLYHGNYKCSECGSWWGSDYNDEIINDFNYCPNCGARMLKGEDDE